MKIKVHDTTTGADIEEGSDVRFPDGKNGYTLGSVEVAINRRGVEARAEITPFTINADGEEEPGESKIIGPAVRVLDEGQKDNGSDGSYLVTITDPLGAAGIATAPPPPPARGRSKQQPPVPPPTEFE